MALPYAPEGYYRAPQSNISELIMRQGDIAARRAEQNARIWGGAIQDIGNVAGQAITQHAEQKSLSKQAAALDAILSDPNGPDPQKIIKTLGYHNGIEVVKGLQAIHPQVSYEDASMREYDAAKAILASPEELRPGLYEKARAQLTTLGHLDPKVAPETYDEGFLRRVVAQRAPAKDAPKLERIADNLGGGKVNIRYVDPSKVGPEGITVNEAAVAPKRSLFDILNDPNVPEVDKQKAIVAERQASAAGRGPVAPERPERLTVEQELDEPRTTPERRKKLLDNQAALAAARREPSGGKGSDDLSRRIDSAQSMIGRLETLSKKLIISSGPTQKAIGYGREAASKMGWDADYLTYSDLRQSLAAQVAVATQGARPSDADVFRAALPMVPDPKRDNESSAAQKWGAIHDMFENLSPEGKKQIVAVGGGGSGEITVKDPTGKSHSFATQAEADQFKQAIRIP